jgi:tetratricopeptide (TPR) repeat protein
MDSPTVCATIPELKGGESRELNLVASFNEEIFKTEGVIPLTGEIRINYSALGKRSQQTASIGYDLYDKRALIWDDDRKIAALITPADSSLRNYVSFIHQISKNKTWSVLNTSLQGGTQLYNALSALGCVYQPDPQLPFNKARVTANMNTSPTETKPPAANAPTVDLIASAYKIDTVNLPRETLKQITGDCDDLTVLYCALLETMGIESGFITTPGHIFPAFNTKLPARQYAKLHPDRQFSININGELWIPVEITKLGQKTFLQAWERGAKEWYIWEEKPENRNFYATSEAQKVYRPVGLKETDLGLQYGSKQEIIRLCETDILQVTETVCSYHEQQAAKSGLAEDYNKLGIVYSEFGLYAQAEAAFQKVLQIDAQYLIAKINLGHLAFYQKHYEQAVKVYLEVLQWLENNRNESSPYLLNINLCLSAVYNELKDSYNTRLFYEKARQIDAKKAEQMAYVNANDGTQEGAAVTKERSQDYLATRVGLLFRYQESVFQD